MAIVRLLLVAPSSLLPFLLLRVPLSTCFLFSVRDSGELGSAQPLLLNATASQDLDGFSAVPFRYSWSCVESASRAACVRASGAALDMAAYVGGTVALPEGTLRAGVYVFSVAVTKGFAGGLIPHSYRVAR